MRKYIIPIFAALVIGFFLTNFFIKQYKNYNGLTVSNVGEELYFIQYGVYSNLENMEQNTISLQNYVYNESDGKYYVYIGMTSLKENADKIVNYYKKNGYNTIVKQYSITNKNFINELKKYDDIIKNTQDETAIISVENEVLTKYEEVVISGGKN